MFRTLYAKLATGLALLLVAIGLLYAVISTTATRHALQELNQQLNRNLAQTLVADRDLVREGRLNEEALKETFNLYMDINPGIEIYLLDLDGNILSFSADPAKIKRKRVSLAPIRAFLTMEHPYPLLGDDPRSHDRQKAFSVTPVPSAGNANGYLYVVLRGEQFDSAENMVRDSFFVRMSGFAVAISLGVGLLAGLVAFRLLTRRLQRLAGAMEAFEQGGFTNVPAGAAGEAGKGDEIDRLGHSFQAMAARIGDQIEQLKGQDELRRRLVAQISHDLRTPLAAMRGYVESLQMKGDALSAEQRAEFLDAALRQGQQLSHMVAELFELASLDARERMPERIAFAPAELAHDVAQKYRLRAEKAGISIEVRSHDALPFVRGDIGMTERVFDNLLDNAIGHTPEGGRIEIALAVAGGGVETRVCNSGAAIGDEDLAHLFEPFYRGEGGAPGRRHAGLGLAIARRIMEEHGGWINLHSPEGRGATFALVFPAGQEQTWHRQF